MTPPIMVVRGKNLPNEPSKRLYSYVFGIVIFVTYFCLVTRIITNEGYRAQDFELHLRLTQEILSGKSRWEVEGTTNPPLLYMAALSMRAFGELWGIKIAAMLLALLNLVGLYLLSKLVRPLLSDSWKLWFVAFTATLPAYVITSVVYAPDALTIFPCLDIAH